MKMIKLYTIIVLSLSLYGMANAQNTPLYNGSLPDVDQIQKKDVPRSFDASRLQTTSPDGSVRDFTQSPCYSEIGFNPNMSQEEIIAEYDFCESEKRRKNILTAAVILLGIAILGVMIRSNFKREDTFTGT